MIKNKIKKIYKIIASVLIVVLLILLMKIAEPVTYSRENADNDNAITIIEINEYRDYLINLDKEFVTFSDLECIPLWAREMDVDIYFGYLNLQSYILLADTDKQNVENYYYLICRIYDYGIEYEKFISYKETLLKSIDELREIDKISLEYIKIKLIEMEEIYDTGDNNGDNSGDNSGDNTGGNPSDNNSEDEETVKPTPQELALIEALEDLHSQSMVEIYSLWEEIILFDEDVLQGLKHYEEKIESASIEVDWIKHWILTYQVECKVLLQTPNSAINEELIIYCQESLDEIELMHELDKAILVNEIIIYSYFANYKL